MLPELPAAAFLVCGRGAGINPSTDVPMVRVRLSDAIRAIPDEVWHAVPLDVFAGERHVQVDSSMIGRWKFSIRNWSFTN